MSFTALELCAGAGGQALGIEKAGFEHLGLIEFDKYACDTLRKNRPDWNVFQHDLFQPFEYLHRFSGVDLLAGGLPCPPFSVAGKQLGELDERNLFEVGVRYAEILRPRAVMFENVKGILHFKFDDYRKRIERRLSVLGYHSEWHVLQASHFKVAQNRSRAILVAMKSEAWIDFHWPCGTPTSSTVGSRLYRLMKANGWAGAEDWRMRANDLAPTLVGGSKKHGGADLGPTRTKQAWSKLGVDGSNLAKNAPDKEFVGDPKLTLQMAARLQGFPASWKFVGPKTAVYRQIGNALPPGIAYSVAEKIRVALEKSAPTLIENQ